MGGTLSTCGRETRGRRCRVCIFGPNGSGKTSLVNQLKFREMVITIPTVGTDVSEIKVGRRSITLLDCGGHCTVRPLWRRALFGASGVIYVIDSSDPEGMEVARRDFDTLLRIRNSLGLPILLLSNKSDVEGAMRLNEVEAFFTFGGVCGSHWIAAEASMTRGSGIEFVEQWLQIYR
jgi:small GTP-binding protein